MKQGLTIVSSVSQACTSELSQTLSSSWVISQVIHTPRSRCLVNCCPVGLPQAQPGCLTGPQLTMVGLEIKSFLPSCLSVTCVSYSALCPHRFPESSAREETTCSRQLFYSIQGHVWDSWLDVITWTWDDRTLGFGQSRRDHHHDLCQALFRIMTRKDRAKDQQGKHHYGRALGVWGYRHLEKLGTEVSLTVLRDLCYL